MSFNTARLSLTTPTLFDSMAVGDLVLASNYQKIDAGIGVTSIPNVGSRPSSPFQGQIVYQVDVALYFLWNGASWVKFSSINVGRVVNFFQWNTLVSHTTTESFQSGWPKDIALTSGKTYAIGIQHNALQSVLQVHNVFLRISPGAGTCTTASPLIKQFTIGMDPVAGVNIGGCYNLSAAYVAPSTGTFSLGLSVAAGAGTVSSCPTQVAAGTGNQLAILEAN